MGPKNHQTLTTLSNNHLPNQNKQQSQQQPSQQKSKLSFFFSSIKYPNKEDQSCPPNNLFPNNHLTLKTPQRKSRSQIHTNFEKLPRIQPQPQQSPHLLNPQPIKRDNFVPQLPRKKEKCSLKKNILKGIFKN